MSAAKKRLVGVLEFMKGEVDDAFNAYHEGTQNAVQSKLRLWASLQDSLQRLSEKAFVNVAWLRIEVPHTTASRAEVMKIIGNEVMTIRYVGPREDDCPAVIYATAKAKRVLEVVIWIAKLKTLGYEVRDWSYGCSRGG